MVDTEVANATATREAEAVENAETTADSKSARVALETTISLLPRFDKGQGKPQRVPRRIWRLMRPQRGTKSVTAWAVRSAWAT